MPFSNLSLGLLETATSRLGGEEIYFPSLEVFLFQLPPPLFVLYEILTSRGSIEANFAFVNWILFSSEKALRV